MSADLGHPDKLVTTTCTYCGVGCQIDLNVKDGEIIRVTSNQNAPVNGMHLCVKGRYGYDFVHHPERLTKPMVRKYLLDEVQTTVDGKEPPSFVDRRSSDWVEVDWDTALTITAQKLRHARDTFGPDSVGVLTSAKCLNEENYLMNKFARQVVGTNSIDHCARL
jgi:formate dehydrogenase major subunit/formate dehydrogenase alpha subunit